MLDELVLYLPYALLVIGIFLLLIGLFLRFASGSSNDRTSGSDNRGSNPRPETNLEK